MANLYIDQMGREVHLKEKPLRIISLVPSQTELLYDLGLDKEVVGITKFCIHPDEWFKTKSRVGGTKNINFDKIKELKPDLIIGSKEENDREQMELLMGEFPVWMSDINSLNDALEMINKIGEITQKVDEAKRIIDRITFKFKELSSKFSADNLIPKSCAYFIWRKPYMCTGGDTFIHQMIEHCGLRNVFSELLRYPELKEEEIKKANPDFVFLSSEPYPFKEKHIKEFQKLCLKAKILLVDGELFSWYGSRLLKAPKYFIKLMKTIYF